MNREKSNSQRGLRRICQKHKRKEECLRPGSLRNGNSQDRGTVKGTQGQRDGGWDWDRRVATGSADTVIRQGAKHQAHVAVGEEVS